MDKYHFEKNSFLLLIIKFLYRIMYRISIELSYITFDIIVFILLFPEKHDMKNEIIFFLLTRNVTKK